MLSLSLSKFIFFIAETSTNKVSPLKSSAISSYCIISFLILLIFLLGKSHLLIATMIGAFAAFACFIASIVCGLIPSSAATTRTTTSVILEPLALISVNAAWPGVSINVIISFFSVLTWYAPICWVIPPCSLETIFESLRESSKEVFPWSTWPIIVTTGGLLLISPCNFSFFLFISKSSWPSNIGLCPNSLTIYSAVSLSIIWFIVAITFILNKNLIISFDFSAILFESSWIEICSDIFTSLTTFLNSFFSSKLLIFFLSFSRALFTEAKLLCLISISSTFKALETVNLKSLLSTGPFNFNLLFPAGFSSFLIKAFVACCSINFLANFLFFGSWLLLGLLKFEFDLFGSRVALNGFFFSMEKDFFPSLLIAVISIFFFKSVEIVSVFFLFLSSIALFVYDLSSRHN